METGLNALGAVLVASIVAVVLGSFQLIKYLQSRNGKGKASPDFPVDVKAAIFDMRREVKDLKKQHAPEDGIERWKWPRELSEIIRAIAETQRLQSQLMETWGNNLQNHQQKEEGVLQEIRDTLRDMAQVLRLRRSADHETTT